METLLQELKNRLLEYVDLGATGSLLGWDQSTYMPLGGAEARARQTALLGKLAQEKFTDPAVGKLLDALKSYEQSLPYDSNEASLIRVTRREYERQVKIPPELIGQVFGNAAQAYQAWMKARPEDDFQAVVPHLERTLELSRQVADCFPGSEHIADPLIDMVDYGMTAASLRALFADLREQLVPIVQAITSQPPTDDSCLKRHYPEAKQLEFSEKIAREIFHRRRSDHHSCKGKLPGRSIIQHHP
jgi:carboxypeptidase Taq